MWVCASLVDVIELAALGAALNAIGLFVDFFGLFDCIENTHGIEVFKAPKMSKRTFTCIAGTAFERKRKDAGRGCERWRMARTRRTVQCDKWLIERGRVMH